MRPAHSAREIEQDWLESYSCEIASMRPAHSAREISTPAEYPTCRRPRFNEAPRIQRGKSTTFCSTKGGKLARFNEARAFSAGNLARWRR